MYSFPPWRVYDLGQYVVAILEGEGGLHPDDDYVDVEIWFREGGKRFGATFFTLANVATLMDRWKDTGECLAGSYFWASHAIIVRRLDYVTILRTVGHLVETGELASAFEQLKSS